jgi:formate hydrogenlyase transcriptional activator
MSDKNVLEILQQAKIFQGLSDEYMGMIFTRGDLIDYNQNDVIIEEGQTGHPLYIIVEGQVEVFLPKKKKYYTQERPTKVKLNHLVSGDCIGEYSLIDNEPASASVAATEPCKIFTITRKDFLEILNSSDYLAKIIYKNMLKVLIKRARQYSHELDLCF